MSGLGREAGVEVLHGPQVGGNLVNWLLLGQLAVKWVRRVISRTEIGRRHRCVRARILRLAILENATGYEQWAKSPNSGLNA